MVSDGKTMTEQNVNLAGHTESGVVSAAAWSGSAAMMAAPASSAVKTAAQYDLLAYWRLWGAGRENWISPRMGGPKSPSEESLWVNACITAIAENVARVPMRISVGAAAGTRAAFGCKGVRCGRPDRRKLSKAKGKGAHFRAAEGEIVESGELWEFLQQPSEGFSQSQWLAALVGYMYASGRVHVLFDDMPGATRQATTLLPGIATKPVYEDSGISKRLTGWKILTPRGAEVPLGLADNIALQCFSPENPQEGLCPATPANLAIVSDYNASTYNAAMFGNNCEPGGAIQSDEPFDAEQDELMKQTWHASHGGPMNARKLAVLWNGLKWQAISSTMTDMQFMEGKTRSAIEICAAYRTDPVIVGFFGRTGDSSAYVDAALRRWWQDTIAPLISRLAEMIQDHIAPRFGVGLEVWGDVEDVPVYQAMRNEQLKAVDSLWAKGVPLADLNDMYELGLPEQPQHEIGYLPSSIVPAGEVGGLVNPAGEAPPPPAAGGGDGEAGDSEADDGPTAPRSHGPTDLVAKAAGDKLATAIWNAWWRSWQGLAKAMSLVIRGRLVVHERRGLQALRTWSESLLQPAGLSSQGLAVASKAVDRVAKDSLVVERVLFDVFGGMEGRRESAEFQARVRTFLADAGSLGIEQALVEAGLVGDELKAAIARLTADPRTIAALRSDAIRISTRIDAAERTILRRNLETGLREGEDIRKLADRVESVMQRERADALRVARNAVGQATSQARYEGRQEFATHEIWIHSRGPGIRRPSHTEAEVNSRANPKPIGTPWLIGGAVLRFPRDPLGPPGEIINCQCLVIGKRLKLAGKQKPNGAAILAEQLAAGFVAWHPKRGGSGGHRDAEDTEQESLAAGHRSAPATCLGEQT